MKSPASTMTFYVRCVFSVLFFHGTWATVRIEPNPVGLHNKGVLENVEDIKGAFYSYAEEPLLRMEVVKTESSLNESTTKNPSEEEHNTKVQIHGVVIDPQNLKSLLRSVFNKVDKFIGIIKDKIVLLQDQINEYLITCSKQVIKDTGIKDGDNIINEILTKGSKLTKEKEDSEIQERPQVRDQIFKKIWRCLIGRLPFQSTAVTKKSR